MRNILEIYSEVELQTSIVGGIEGVVANVGETDVVGQVAVEHVVCHAAAQTKTTIQSLEVVIVERALGFSILEVLDFSTNAYAEVAT